MSIENPYRAPQAAVSDYVAPDDGGGFSPTPKACEAAAGLRWLSEAWNYFSSSPGPWIGVTVLWILFALVGAFIPFIGGVVQSLLFPVLLGGIMLGCDALRRGEPLTVAHLFAGFNANAAQLVLVGALYLAGSLAIGLLVFVPLLGFGGLAVFSGDASQAQAVGVAFLLGALVFLALLLPLVMAIWFAPPLVVFNNLSAIDAMRLSFLGCLKNIVPFLIYGLLGAIIAFAATITLLLGWLVATPIFMASIYVSYREIFYTG